MTAHPNDGQLIQLLDGSLHDEPDVSAHVEDCAQCQTRLRTIETRCERLGLLLQQSDHPVPGLELQFARRRHIQLRVAAAIVMLLVGGFSVEPVRAWIFSQGRAAWQRVFVSDHNVLQTPIAAATTDTLNEVDLGFRPQQSTLRVDVQTRQASGSLIMRRGRAPDVTATITDAAEGDGIIILPHGLRIENSISSTATYVITIPPSIEAVEIVLAGEVVAAFRVGPSFNEDIVDIRTRVRS